MRAEMIPEPVEGALDPLARGVLVQPGYFFDLDDGGTLVLSLIPEPPCFAEGVARVLALVRELAS